MPATTGHMNEHHNVDPAEIARFEAAASRWWDPQGEMRPLHDLNPVRLQYVERAGSLAGLKVLDVGCGGGLLAEAMARKVAQVTGLERGHLTGGQRSGLAAATAGKQSPCLRSPATVCVPKDTTRVNHNCCRYNPSCLPVSLKIIM